MRVRKSRALAMSACVTPRRPPIAPSVVASSAPGGGGAARGMAPVRRPAIRELTESLPKRLGHPGPVASRVFAAEVLKEDAFAGRGLMSGAAWTVPLHPLRLSRVAPNTRHFGWVEPARRGDFGEMRVWVAQQKNNRRTARFRRRTAPKRAIFSQSQTLPGADSHLYGFAGMDKRQYPRLGRRHSDLRREASEVRIEASTAEAEGLGSWSSSKIPARQPWRGARVSPSACCEGFRPW